ncbi:MAG: hypothetical protein JWM28_2578, partial [Chitinophagaceae bacterium]|nr:hypothetical protein [Chitinophagaceae bacterium]
SGEFNSVRLSGDFSRNFLQPDEEISKQTDKYGINLFIVLNANFYRKGKLFLQRLCHAARIKKFRVLPF